MNKIIIAIIVLLLIIVGGLYLLDQSVPEDAEVMDQEQMETQDDENETEALDLSGIHIMADGTVMLGNGETLPDATVTEDGMIELPDGRIIEPVMDMREGGSMEDMEMDATNTESNANDGTMSDPSTTEDESTNDGGTSSDDEEDNTNTISLEGFNYGFSQEEIRVQEGDTVTINFTSTDGFHDWVVDAFDAQTDRVSTGETATVTFTADEAGTYEFYCSVGNHRQQGMVGTLIVE